MRIGKSATLGPVGDPKSSTEPGARENVWDDAQGMARVDATFLIRVDWTHHHVLYGQARGQSLGSTGRSDTHNEARYSQVRDASPRRVIARCTHIANRESRRHKRGW